MTRKELEAAFLKLKEENAYLKFGLEELRSKRYKTGKSPPQDDSEKAIPKKKGGLFGHLGWFRKKSDKIDEHIQEDITLPKVETVFYRHYHYYCKHCRKVISSKGEDELANSYIGPKAFAAFLRYGIKIAASSIAGFRYQLKRAGSPLYQKLIQSLKTGSFIHADETG